MKKVIYFVVTIIIIFAVIIINKSIVINNNDYNIREIIMKIDKNEWENLSININSEKIDNKDFEIQRSLLEAYTKEEKESYNKDNEIIEAIKHNIILQEAQKNNIQPNFDEEHITKTSMSMYENSDKTLSQEEYIEKWNRIQKESEIQNLYMADTMMKITSNEMEFEDDELKEMKQIYIDNLTVENLRKFYEMYVESLINQYNIKIELKGNEIYKNYN